MLIMNSITKIFQGRDNQSVTALNEINLTINKGDLITIVGPSGSGKSTLLYTIGGMLEPTEGEVFFNGVNIYELSHKDRTNLRKNQIGFIFQTFNLIPYLNCLENVALPSILAGNKRQSSIDKAENLLKNLGVGQRLMHRPAELSVGERQRVAICRSIINDPDILVADEPTGNLDIEMTREVITLLQALNLQGQTIVVVTHNPDVAKAGANIITLKNGMITNNKFTRHKKFN